jgi:hypothetical protein
MRESRGPWYLLTGVVIGLALGVLYGWLIAPVSYTDTQPHTLRADLKDEYRTLIALAYLSNGNAARAQTRLELLRDVNPAEVLALQAQRRNAAGPQDEVRALGLLAGIAGAPPLSEPSPVAQSTQPEALGTASPSPAPSETEPAPSETPAPSNSPTPAETQFATPGLTPTGAPTRTPTPTNTLVPTATLTPTPGTFIFDSSILACSTTFIGPLLIVRALDSNGNGVPGVEIVLNWPGNQEHFFTGLKPEFGLGYADFQMEPGITYTLRLADGSQLIPDITAEQCDPGNGSLIWGTLSLTFIQP